MTVNHFDDITIRIQYLFQGRHRSNFPGFETHPLVLLIDNYDLETSAEAFIKSVPFDHRFDLAYKMRDERSYWFLFFLLLGFSLPFLAASQNLTVAEAKIEADSEVAILRSLSRNIDQ